MLFSFLNSSDHLAFKNTRTQIKKSLRQITTCIPVSSISFYFAAQAFLDICEGVIVCLKYFTKQCNVCNRQSQRINFTEPFLIWERRHMYSQFIKRGIYTPAYKYSIIHSIRTQYCRSSGFGLTHLVRCVKLVSSLVPMPLDAAFCMVNYSHRKRIDLETSHSPYYCR